MWLRLQKELRELAAPSALVLLAAGAVALLRPALTYTVLLPLGFVITTRVIGAEFDYRTWPRLLAQPISRAQLWGEKLLAGVVTLTAVYAVVGIMSFVLDLRGMPFGLQILHAATALATGPAVALWLRDSSRALWAGLALPVAVAVVCTVVFSLLGLPMTPATTLALQVTYCLALFALGYRSFVQLEIATQRDHWVERSDAGSLENRNWGTLLELTFKEVRLQRSSLILIPFAIAAWVLAWLLSLRGEMPFPGGGSISDVLEIAGFLPTAALVIVVPAFIGVNAVAWERQLGVLDWQLSQPISRRLQWLVKLVVCFALTLLSGLLGALLTFQLSLRLRTPDIPANILMLLVLLAFVMLALGLYSSKLARSPFQALGLCLVLTVAFGYVGALLRYTASFFHERSALGFMLVEPLTRGPVYVCLADVCLILLLAVLVARMPYRQEQWLLGKQWFVSAGFASLLLLVVGAFAAQIYLLDQISAELDEEIVQQSEKIEHLGGLRDAEWIAAEIGIEPQRLDVARAVHVIDVGNFVALNGKTHNPRALQQPVSSAMHLASRFDGVDTSYHSFDYWFWMRVDRGLLYSNYMYVGPSLSLPSRDLSSLTSYMSVAPWWFAEKRRRQLDRSVRQNVIIETAYVGRELQRVKTEQPERFQKLLALSDRFFFNSIPWVDKMEEIGS